MLLWMSRFDTTCLNDENLDERSNTRYRRGGAVYTNRKFTICAGIILKVSSMRNIGGVKQIENSCMERNPSVE